MRPTGKSMGRPAKAAAAPRPSRKSGLPHSPLSRPQKPAAGGIALFLYYRGQHLVGWVPDCVMSQKSHSAPVTIWSQDFGVGFLIRREEQ